MRVSENILTNNTCTKCDNWIEDCLCGSGPTIKTSPYQNIIDMVNLANGSWFDRFCIKFKAFFSNVSYSSSSSYPYDCVIDDILKQVILKTSKDTTIFQQTNSNVKAYQNVQYYYIIRNKNIFLKIWNSSESFNKFRFGYCEFLSPKGDVKMEWDMRTPSRLMTYIFTMYIKEIQKQNIKIN
jgi:hypothetical protein